MPPSNPVDRLSRACGNALSVLFLVAVLLSAFEVVMRYAFNAPTIWVHDSAITLCAIGFIFGGSYALERKGHIRITSIYDHLGPRTRHLLDVVSTVLVAGYLAILLYAVIRQAIPSLKLMETSGRAWDVPIPALMKSMLVVGVALMLLQALAQLHGLLRGAAPDDGAG